MRHATFVALWVGIGLGGVVVNVLHDLYPGPPRPLGIPMKGSCQAIVQHGLTATLCGQGNEAQLDEYLASRGMARDIASNRIGLGQ